MKQVDVAVELSEIVSLICDNNSTAYAVGYMESNMKILIEMLPVRKRAVFLAELRDRVNSTIKVTVNSLMTGEPVHIRLCDKGGPCDPSTERYWTA